MKKLFCLFLAVVMLAGCAPADETESTIHTDPTFTTEHEDVQALTGTVNAYYDDLKAFEVFGEDLWGFFITADTAFDWDISAEPLEAGMAVTVIPGEKVTSDQPGLCAGECFYAREVKLVSRPVDPGEIVAPMKPVIYLYPTETTDVTVKLECEGTVTHTYPGYENGWQVTAHPDGTLEDEKGLSYYCLYWEGEDMGRADFSQGFCVAGRDTAPFLEDALSKLGLTRREANEFIIYWLPLMEGNAYNLISFQGGSYTDAARLDISPAPDTLIRVFMAYKPLEEAVEVRPQELTAPERTGFTVVEWGGSEVN